jgi:hypothetical protein
LPVGPPPFVVESPEPLAPGVLLAVRLNGSLVEESLQASPTTIADAPKTLAARLITFCFMKPYSR